MKTAFVIFIYIRVKNITEEKHYGIHSKNRF